MNWWMLGCGAAVVAEIYTLYLYGKEISKRKNLDGICKYQQLSLEITKPLLKAQNSMIDKLIEKLPDKKDEPA